MAAEDAEAQATGVDHEIVKSVAGANFKVLGDVPAILTKMGLENAISHQNRVNVLSETALAAALKGLSEVDPTEAKSLQALFTGNQVAEQIASLGAAVAGLQEIVKAAQTTPPPTA
jgi:hypothetical protein